ncbi:MAG: citrate/2-methylcitrate synthase, partial [Planctomycetota bacterium]
MSEASSSSAPQEAQVTKGLKGIKAADSSICLVDGAVGKLLYRGYHIDDLAEHCSFEEVAYLLLKGELPTAGELDRFDDPLSKDAALTPAVAEFIANAPADAPPMAVLRTAVSLAGLSDPTADDLTVDGAYRKCIRLVAKLATMTAAIHRARQGKEAIQPQPDRPFAENFVRMIKGSDPTPDETKAMDLILTLHAEHGFNASTFACRVVIATLPDVYGAITAGVAALKGKLHGGANTAVLEALEAIGTPDGIDGYIAEVKANKGKFMGFGHAVYQVEDPRAKHLKRLSRRLGEEQGDTTYIEISEQMDEKVVALIGKNCNVDFYSASTLHYLGIPKEIFTCIFASSRVAGWSAHLLEQLSDNKIIRPSANYTGAADRPVVPIA